MTQSTIPVAIPFAYAAQFIRRGGRVPREIIIKDTMTVLLTHLDDQDAPVSFKLSDCGRFDVREGSTLDIRTALGHHWRPIGSYDGEPSQFDAFTDYLQRGQMSAGKHLLASAIAPTEIGDGRMVSDERDAAMAETSNRIAKLISVAGQVWERTPEPVWVISYPDRHAPGFSAYVDKATSITKPADPRFVFPINAVDERDAALAEYNCRKQLPADFRPLYGQIEVLRAENVGYRHDEEPRLRHHLKNHLEYAGDQVRRSINTISLPAFTAYREFIASVGDDLPITDLVDPLRTFTAAIAGEPGWKDWHSRTSRALEDWDRFSADQADNLALEQYL